MSSKFDWSQFEATPLEQPQEEKFNWSQFTEKEEPESLSFPSLGIGKRVSGENKIPEMKRKFGQTAKVIGSTVAGLPGDLAAQIGEGLNWLAKNVPGGKAKSEEEMSSLVESPFTSGKIQKGIEKLAPSLAPASPEEKEWEDNLSIITSLLTPLPLGKSKALDPRVASKAYKAAKALGLSEKEMTILLHGEGKQSLLGKLAKKTKGLETALDATKNSLENVRGSLGEQAAKLPRIDEPVLDKLIDDFSKIQSNLRKTVKPSEQKAAAIKFIDESLENLFNKGTTPEELMNFYHDVNAAVPWNSIKGGKKALASLKEPILNAIEKSDQIIGDRFRDYNNLYSKMKRFEKAVGLPKIAQYINHGKVASALGYLALGSVGGLKGLVATEALRRISTQLLTNPNWQNLHNKILTSIKNGSSSMAPKLMQAVKKMTKKEMPEEYNEIDWSNPIQLQSDTSQ